MSAFFRVFVSLFILEGSFIFRVYSIGVNLGIESSHRLPGFQVVDLLKSNNFTKIKLFDTDSSILEALSGTGIRVTVGIPNSLLQSLNSSQKAARSWLHDNVTRYISTGGSGAHIEYIAVGDEMFHLKHKDQYHPFVVGTLSNLQIALIEANLQGKIKLVVPCSSDAFLSQSNLPSKGRFRSNINQTVHQLVTFLSTHRSPYLTTISPFLKKNISLNFALFRKARPLNDTHQIYHNTFESIHGTLIAALSSLGFPKMDIVVARIGWPTDGAPDANTSNAGEFMKGLVDCLTVEAYIHTLLDEDLRSTDDGNFERHWGLFTFDGQAKYDVDLGLGSKTLVSAKNVDYLPSRWCVVKSNQYDLSNATARALDACSVADCSALSAGGSCSNISRARNVSYAFNSYYQQHDQDVGSCDFGGLGLITNVDPSTASCRFLVQLRTSNSLSVLESSHLCATMAFGLVLVLSYAQQQYL